MADLRNEVFIRGDLKGHIKQSRDGFEEAVDVYGYREENREGEKILGFSG